MMENLKKRLNKQAGFTLVELLVVIAIIAILSVTAYVALGGQTEKARNSKRQSDLASIQSALEIYSVNNNSQYPATLDALVIAEVISKIPTDPSDDALDYAYARGSNDRKYQLGAVLVDDDGLYTAYVIGNGDDLINKVAVPAYTFTGDDCLGAPVNTMVDGEDCVTYQP